MSCVVQFGLIYILISSISETAYAKEIEPEDVLSLNYVQSLVIDTKKKFKGTKVGGLSGLVIDGSSFYTITDDRGRYGEPRIYRFDLLQRPGNSGHPIFETILSEKISLFKRDKKLKVVDFEALAPFKNGWLVSSEGDLNAKPVAPPEVFFIKDKEIKKSVKIPDEFLPKFKGKQVSGLYNNKAFEGMSYDEVTQQLWLLSESGLSQKQDGDSVFYFLEYKLIADDFVLNKTTKFDFTKKLNSSNLYNGASELLRLTENSFLILTRSVEAALSLQYSNIAWLIKRKSPADEWEVKNKFRISGKADENEIGKQFPVIDVLNQNYEGMAMLVANGKKYLVVVSDDNFNSFEKTVFSFFELEVK